ncbi:MAG: YlxR family protein [Chloroflexi bacterium]|nr:YlxR family protein [Chloroflexota bacterium]
MAKKSKKKHVPQRTCAGCRSVQPKLSLTRVVRTAEGVQIDPTGKLAGRGAYLHDSKACWENGLKGALARALRTEINPDDSRRLAEFMASLPEETELSVDHEKDHKPAPGRPDDGSSIRFS